MKKINREQWKEVYYGDYVDHIEVNEKDPAKRKNARYVSVEHIQTGKLKIESWENEVMPTFFRTFKPGQILFGKRRAYQRKVAIAEFEGICSPHIWALETKKELQQEILPFLMLTDKFYEYANANSAGTMSVYLKWPQLSRYQFLLPPVEKQKEIASLFQSIETAMEQVDGQEKNLKALKCDLLNNLIGDSQSFGQIKKDKWRKIKFSDVVKNSNKIERKPLSVGITKAIGLANINPCDLKIKSFIDIEKEGTNFSRVFRNGQYLFGARRAYLKQYALADFNGVCTANIMVFDVIDDNIMLRDFIALIIQSDVFINYATGTSVGSLFPNAKWSSLAEFKLKLPELEVQKVILQVFDQLETTITQLKKQKTTLKNLKQKLLNEILG